VEGWIVIRRAGLVAVLLMLASATNVFASTKAVGIYNYGYSVANAKVALGTTVKWTNTTAGTPHSATSDKGGFFSTGVLSPGSSDGIPMTQAGSYGYHCLVHGYTMHATVSVKMRVSPSTGGLTTTFTFTLGSGATPSGWHHDVQISRNGGSYKSLTPTTGPTETFKATQKGTYRVRTRLADNGITTGWSPVAAFTVS
jgi:plastocyanin